MASARFELYHVSGPDPALEPRVTWRLLSSNNRDLGRSPISFADVPACQLMVRRLQLLVAEAATVQLRAGRVDWSWRVRLDRADVAVSSRTYQRRIQAESACTVFLSLVPEAGVAQAPRLIRC